jgi:2-dehydropantoate 2-reductase
MTAMRIAVFGAGGVGGYFGARLAQAGESVVFIARGAHLDAIRREGLRVESPLGFVTLRPTVATDEPAAVGAVDAVLMCVKAWQLGDAAKSLRPLLGTETYVVPLQNGVEAADQLAAAVGRERVLGGLCRIVSYVSGPGRIRHAGLEPRIEFGERGRRHSARVDALRGAFAKTIGVSVGTPADIEAAIWAKFLFIAPFSGVGAVVRRPAGPLREVPETRRMLEEAMGEVHRLALARGIELRADAVAESMKFVDGLPEDATASMQRDILDGRPSELEHLSGAVVRLGREAGVPVPVNACLYASLLPAELEARRRKPRGGR